MSKNQTLWVIVADGEHARVLVRGETPDTYHTARSLDSISAHKQTSDLVADSAGRSFESANSARHAIAPRHDPHAVAKERFLHEVAQEINQAAIDAAFDRLVLVAPAHALSELRDALRSEATTRLVGVLQKDLVKIPDHEIGNHLTWDVLHTGSL